MTGASNAIAPALTYPEIICPTAAAEAVSPISPSASAARPRTRASASCSAVVSAGTVIAGMGCLLAADSADISGLGPVAAIGIAVGLLAMITLLPALLVIFGRWMFWPKRPTFG